ncbi:hypothetical protein [Candidatus Nitrospira bockiana]
MHTFIVAILLALLIHGPAAGETTFTKKGGAGGGAPTDGEYWTGAANGTLTAEKNLGALGTGLVINTAGAPSIYAGATCTNQVIRVLSASGAPTCQTITSAYVDTSIWTGTAVAGMVKAASQGVLANAVGGVDFAAPNTANAWSDGIKQTFNPNGTTAGVNVGAHTADPSSPANGDIYYNSTSHKFRCYENSAWKDCDTQGGTSTYAVATKTGAYTLTTSDKVILCDASAGGFTLTLPPVTGNTGVFFIIKKTDSSANTCTVDGNASETIDDGLTAAITIQYNSISIVTDGVKWHIF